MKKFILPLIAISAIVAVALGQAPFPENVYYHTLNTGVTNMVATSTNTTAGQAFILPSQTKGVMLSMTATGGASTTNGTLTVYFQRSQNEGTNYENAATSFIKLQMSSLAGNTFTVSDWFHLVGANRIRVGRVENTFQGPVSNLTFVISYPYDANTQNR